MPLCVHPSLTPTGVAASDVACCKRLGVHSEGQVHAAAIALLGKSTGSAATRWECCWTGSRRPGIKRARCPARTAGRRCARRRLSWNSRGIADGRAARELSLIPSASHGVTGPAQRAGAFSVRQPWGYATSAAA